MKHFNAYQEFVKTMKVYPSEYKMIYPTLGLVGEAGEVAEKVKKVLRGDRVIPREEIAKEVGDVLWYAAALAEDLGYTLEEIVMMNVAKLSDRKERGVVKGDGDRR